MEPVPLKLFADALGLPLSYSDNSLVSGVSTDTRTLQPGDLFVALKGENPELSPVQALLYLHDAYQKDAVAAVVSQSAVKRYFPLLRVVDTLKALGDMAQSYRNLFKIPVIGITGSAGKTSTKEMLAHILRTQKRVLSSEKNFNNEIGVPQTVFRLALEDDIAVIEMGMRGPGEIARLLEIAQPNIGIITNIGMAHIERLGSMENIAHAKAELFAGLPGEGIAIYPVDSPYSEILSAAIPVTCRRKTTSIVPSIKADIELIGKSTITQDGSGVEFVVHSTTSGQNVDFKLSVPGMHHVSNALSAIAAAESCGFSLQECADALSTWPGADGRMEIRKIGDDITLLDDCYNAGPESMSSAISTLSSIPGKRKVAILGDMKELGDKGKTAHFTIGEQVSRERIELLVTVGEMAKDIERGALVSTSYTPEVMHYCDSGELSKIVNKIVCPGDVVLIKGSHAMEMECIVQNLISQRNHPDNG